MFWAGRELPGRTVAVVDEREVLVHDEHLALPVGVLTGAGPAEEPSCREQREGKELERPAPGPRHGASRTRGRTCGGEVAGEGSRSAFAPRGTVGGKRDAFVLAGLASEQHVSGLICNGRGAVCRVPACSGTCALLEA